MVATNSSNKLTNWVYTRQVGLVKIDSKNKIYSLETTDQRHQDVNTIDYKSRIESGWYNRGVAARMGWTIGHKYFAVGIDLDGWDAVKAWFGGSDSDEEIWNNVERYAKNNLVEWHNDRTSLHLIIYLKEPISNAVISLPGHSKEDRRQIEIHGEGQLLCISPSIAKDGNPFTALDSEVIPIIDSISLFTLKAIIDKLFKQYCLKDYLSDNENQATFEWLHDPKTIFGEGQGRHGWTVWITNSYFWKWSGEWLDLTDNERFERAWKWHVEHCIPPRAREEFDRICRDVSRKYIQERDRKHDEIRKQKETTHGQHKYSQEVEAELTGKIVAEYSQTPTKWFIGDPQLKIIRQAVEGKREIESQNGVGKVTTTTTAYYISYARTIFNCCVSEVTIFQNPLSWLGQVEKFKIKFDSVQWGEFTLEGMIEKIISQLDAKGCLMYQYAAKEALVWMINTFKENNKCVIDKSVDFEGYLYYGGDLHISRIDFQKKHPRRTREECLSYIKYLEKKAEFFQWEYEGQQKIDRRDWLASSIKWTVAAPFNFAIKQLTGKYQNWFSFSGERDGGKSDMSNRMLEMHGNFLEGSDAVSIYSLTAGQFDTCSKLGRALCKTTYPISVSEFGNVEDKGRNEDFSEDMKNAIEKLVSRNGREGSQYDVPFPSCSSCIINGNPRLSCKDTVIKRFYNVKFSKEDRHDRNNPKTLAFNEFMRKNQGMEKILGDWSMNYIWDHRQELILSKKYDTKELGQHVVNMFFTYHNVEMPEWLNRWIVDNTLEELEVDQSDIIRAVLYEHTYKSIRDARIIGIIGDDKNERIDGFVDVCLDKGLWSFARKVKINRFNTAMTEEVCWIDASVLGLFKDKIPDLSLKRLGEKMGKGFKYKHTKQGFRLQCTPEDIKRFLKGEVEDLEEDSG